MVVCLVPLANAELASRAACRWTAHESSAGFSTQRSSQLCCAPGPASRTRSFRQCAVTIPNADWLPLPGLSSEPEGSSSGISGCRYRQCVLSCVCRALWCWAKAPILMFTGNECALRNGAWRPSVCQRRRLVNENSLEFTTTLCTDRAGTYAINLRTATIRQKR